MKIFIRIWSVLIARKPARTWLAIAALGASVAAPLSLGASAAIDGHNGSQQQSTPDERRPPRSQRPPQAGDGSPGKAQPPAGPRPPRNGSDGSQGRPPRDGGPGRPPVAAPPPQEDQPPVKPAPPSGSKPPQGKPPKGTPPRPAPGRPPRPNRPPTPRPPVHYHPRPPRGPYPHFVWGPGSGWRLHQYFLADIRRVDRVQRPYLSVGSYLWPSDLDRMRQIPPDLLAYLPQVPAGYAIGYYDGYCLVYDPYSLMIVGMIDLYEY